MTTDHQIFEHLLMKAIDQQLNAEERQRFEAHLVTCRTCQEEYQDFKAIKDRTDTLSQRIMQDAAGIPPRERPGARRLVTLATLSIVAGLLFLIAFAGYHLALDPQTPLLVKSAAALVTAGGLALASHAFYQRARAHRTDPYQEIDQ